MAGVADEDENATQKTPTQNLQPLWRIFTDEDDLIESELRGNWFQLLYIASPSL